MGCKGVARIQLAVDRGQAPSLVNTAMDLRVPCTIGSVQVDEQTDRILGFEALTAVVMKSSTILSVESQQTFRRNLLPSASGSKNKPSKKPA
jgi:hypothetical protein